MKGWGHGGVRGGAMVGYWDEGVRGWGGEGWGIGMKGCWGYIWGSRRAEMKWGLKC